MNKYAFLLLLVSSLANAHGGELTFLFNHALINLGLVIFSAFVSPPGVKLAISMGLMIAYPVLFFTFSQPLMVRTIPGTRPLI